LEFNVTKALFYACDSYPKIAAPHRFSPYNDFEICILTTFSSIAEVYLNVRKYIEELKKGLRVITDINIGETLAQGLMSSLKNVGSNAIVELSIASILSLYLNYMMRIMQFEFHDSLRHLYRAMSLNNVEETLTFIKTLKNFGGEIAILLDKAEITERKIVLENARLIDVFQNLSRVSLRFEAFTNLQKVLNVLNIVEDIARNLNDINSILSRLSLILCDEKFTKLDPKSITEILKIDIEYRRKNKSMLHIMPYIVFASLYIVVVKGY
jgi:hypothetical protein